MMHGGSAPLNAEAAPLHGNVTLNCKKEETSDGIQDRVAAKRAGSVRAGPQGGESRGLCVHFLDLPDRQIAALPSVAGAREELDRKTILAVVGGNIALLHEIIDLFCAERAGGLEDIASAILYLKQQATMAIVLVEQYFEFAKSLADRFVVMDRGEAVLSGDAATLVEDDVRRHITV